MNPVGYLINTRQGLFGTRGSHYSYIMAQNGVWVEARNDLLAARVLVSPGEFRGLKPLGPLLTLAHGKIPQFFWELAFDALLADLSTERYVCITASITPVGSEYRFSIPPQDRSAAGVSYGRLPMTVLDLHSHPGMRAFFSSTDCRDEVGFQIYGVLGVTVDGPAIRLRVGIYGHFHDIPWPGVFSGSLVNCLDMNNLEVEHAKRDP